MTAVNSQCWRNSIDLRQDNCCLLPYDLQLVHPVIHAMVLTFFVFILRARCLAHCQPDHGQTKMLEGMGSGDRVGVIAVQLSSVPWLIGSLGRHERWFSRGPLPVFSAGEMVSNLTTWLFYNRICQWQQLFPSLEEFLDLIQDIFFFFHKIFNLCAP